MKEFLYLNRMIDAEILIRRSNTIRLAMGTRFDWIVICSGSLRWAAVAIEKE